MKVVCMSPRAQFIPLERRNDHALDVLGISLWNDIQNHNLLNGSLHSNAVEFIVLTHAAALQIFYYKAFKFS